VKQLGAVAQAGEAELRRTDHQGDGQAHQGRDGGGRSAPRFATTTQRTRAVPRAGDRRNRSEEELCGVRGRWASFSAIEPWNFPFWQVFRAAVPSVSAGNVVVLKHASNVPMTALAIEDAFRKAGFRRAFSGPLLIDPAAAVKLIDDDLVDAVALTGSNRAGEEIGAHAGGRIKKLVLELGGSDPFIVLDDADVEKAGRPRRMRACVNSARAASRPSGHRDESVAEEFTKHFIARLREMKIGDPMDETTDIGPLARKDIA